MEDEYREPMEQYHEKLHEPLDLDSREHQLLSCPNCGHFVKAEDINVDKTLAKCSSCDHVFNFGHDLPHLKESYSRPGMLIPEGLEVLKLRSELDVEINWWKSGSKGFTGFLLTFTLMWNLILLPFVITAIATGQWNILLFTSVHLIVGISMLVRVFAQFFNTTRINLTRRYLEIRTRPIPDLFKRDRKIPVEDISQLYVTKYVSARKNNTPQYAHALYALLKNGQKIRLVKGMNLETQRYLEHEMESFLHIEDEQVAGELSKRVK